MSIAETPDDFFGPDWRDYAADAGWIDPVDVTKALRDVWLERDRQQDVEGWTPEHDDEHDLFELARAGACYALLAAGYKPDHEIIQKLWPFERAWLKPSDTRRRDLVKGGAMMLADIERLDRAEARKTGAFGLHADDFDLMEKLNGNGWLCTVPQVPRQSVL